MDRVVLKPFGKDQFELTQTYRYLDIKVPCGYKTNGADIPRCLWSFFPPNSPEYLSAVVVHDYMCANATNKAEYERADYYFYMALGACGVAHWKQTLFFKACRAYHSLKFAFKK